MKKYIGTKIVQATPMARGDAEAHLGRDVGGEYGLDTDGQLVEYDNGYQAWSQQDVFDAAYRQIDNMTFGLAIEALKLGKRVARAGWNGKGIFIEIQVPDENSKMTSPYIYINTTGLQTDNQLAPKSLVPWLASQTDMLSEDWLIVD